MDEVDAAEEKEQVGLVEGEGGTPEVALDQVLRVAPVRELLQGAVKDVILARGEA